MRETLCRRIARAFARHAAQVMPQGEMGWGQAMQNECEAVENDQKALRWAVGCVFAGYWESSNAMLQTWYARGLLACLIVLLGLREFFAPFLIFSYRMHYLGLANFLGMRTAGHDYRRLIPVMDAIPAWLPVLWAASGLLFLAALWRMLRRQSASGLLFFLAFGLDLVGLWVVRSIQASTGVVITPNPIVRAGGVVLTFLTGMVLWRMTRKRDLTENG